MSSSSDDASGEDDDFMAQFDAIAGGVEKSLASAAEHVTNLEEDVTAAQADEKAAIQGVPGAAAALGAGAGADDGRVSPPVAAARTRQNELGSNSAQVAALREAEEANEQLSQQIEQLRSVLETMEVSNEQLSSELEQRHVETAQQAHELDQRDGEINSLRSSLAKQKERLSGHSTESVELHTQVAAQANELREKEAALRQLEARLEERSRAPAGLADSGLSAVSTVDAAAAAEAAEAAEQSARAQDAALARVVKQLEEARAEVETLEGAAVKEKDETWEQTNEVRKLKSQLKKAAKARDTLTAELADAHAQSEARGEEAGAHASGNKQLQATVRELRDQLADARESHAVREMPPSPGESLGSLDAELEAMKAEEALAAQKRELEATFATEQKRVTAQVATERSARADAERAARESQVAVSKLRGDARALRDKVAALEASAALALAKGEAAGKGASSEVAGLKRKVKALAQEAAKEQHKRAAAESELATEAAKRVDLESALRQTTAEVEQQRLNVARREARPHGAAAGAAAAASSGAGAAVVARSIEEATRAVRRRVPPPLRARPFPRSPPSLPPFSCPHLFLFAFLLTPALRTRPPPPSPLLRMLLFPLRSQVDAKLFATKQKLAVERAQRKAAESALVELRSTHTELASLAGDHEARARKLRRRASSQAAQQRVTADRLAAVTAERDRLQLDVDRLTKRIKQVEAQAAAAASAGRGRAKRRAKKKGAAGGGSGGGSSALGAARKRHRNVREEERKELEDFEKRLGSEKWLRKLLQAELRTEEAEETVAFGSSKGRWSGGAVGSAGDLGHHGAKPRGGGHKNTSPGVARSVQWTAS